MHALIEAMSCGTPVIAANTATAPEILGRAGVLFTPQNAHDLAEKVLKLLNDSKLREKLSIESIERVKKYFT